VDSYRESRRCKETLVMGAPRLLCERREEEREEEEEEEERDQEEMKLPAPPPSHAATHAFATIYPGPRDPPLIV